jgi:hypothetical protein
MQVTIAGAEQKRGGGKPQGSQTPPASR